MPHPAFQPPIHPPVLHLVAGLIRMLFLFGGAFLLLRYYLKHTRKPLPAAVASPNREAILPLRLQAFERLVLLLERIHPSNLVMRLNNPELTAAQMHLLLVRTIREEFEYNLSQQLYISSQTWELIRNAREGTVAMINQAVSELPESAQSADLIKKIFDLAITRGKLPVDLALEAVKRELKQLF